MSDLEQPMPTAPSIQVAPASFVSGGSPEEPIEVRISYGIIDRFSEGLYSSPNKAFEELVSNSYDAGATRVWVRIPETLDDSTAYLAVIDDGDSMDLQGLRELWQVGVSPKRADDGSDAVVHGGRQPIGKFGIGKLATYVLAEQLTYLCRSNGVIRAVTMDYSRARGEMSDPKPMSLSVVILSEAEARATLEEVLGNQDPVFSTLFGAQPLQTWTAAIMSDLKPRGQEIQLGRLRWILRTALPLTDQFQLWFNSEPLESSKIDAVSPWEFTVGDSDGLLNPWPYAALTTTDEAGQPGVQLEHAGFVRGVARLYDTSLKGGKSDEHGRSHGFFVKVRERLINLDDETFGIDVELSHGVLSRFQMVVFADGLDDRLSSPRESIQESPALRELKNYLLAVFNRARSWRSKQEEKGDGDLLASSERIAGPPATLSTEPLRRILRRATGGDAAVVKLFRFDQEDLDGATLAIDSSESLLQQVLIEPLGQEKPLVEYDISRRAAVVNSNHPFINNYIDTHGAAEPLRLVGVTELLTQVYMIDEDLDPALVHKILDRRDEFLRALVNIHPRSAAVVARTLHDSKGLRDELEDSVADALSLLGYEVTRIGGNGNPDGTAHACLGARSEGGGSQNYLVTYDAKSSGKDAIKAATAGTATLRKHRSAHKADFSLLVAPGFQGSSDESSSIVENCTVDKITPVTVDQLARIVRLFPFRGLTPETLRPLFALHAPSDVEDWIADLEAQGASGSPPPIGAILGLTRDLSSRKDAVTVSALSTALQLSHGIDYSIGELRGLLRGLAALAPNTLWWEEDGLALNAAIPAVVAELRSTVEPVSDEIAGVFKQALEDTP